MAASTTDLEIAQKACSLVGIVPIASFTPSQPTAEATLLDSLYEQIIQSELEAYPWRWAMKMAQLSFDNTTPLARWESRYEEPTDVIMPRTVLVGNYPINYDRYDSYIYSDTTSTDVVILEYTYRAIVKNWSPGFQLGMVQRLGAALAVGVQERPDKSKELNSEGDITLTRAKTSDSQGQTSKGFNQNQFTSNRVSGRFNLRTKSNST